MTTVIYRPATTSGAGVLLKAALRVSGAITFAILLAMSLLATIIMVAVDGDEARGQEPGGVAFFDQTRGLWNVDGSEFYFGNPGDYPMYCDWDGDGIATPGLYRETSGFLYLRNSNTAGFADIEIFFGIPGDRPLCGDWNMDGIQTIGIYRASADAFYLRNSNTQGFADIT
ncbi:MAG: hypothetical protein HKO76_07070, partial [Acidimicrobiia bacterium]|nr:hypothetical protein [Acidimicrobiia bacterium]